MDRLHGLLSGGAIAARLGGDEFAILIGSADAGERAELLATRVVNLFDTPFLVDGQDVRLSASVGLAVYPHHAKSAAELLAHSPLALFDELGLRAQLSASRGQGLIALSEAVQDAARQA